MANKVAHRLTSQLAIGAMYAKNALILPYGLATFNARTKITQYTFETQSHRLHQALRHAKTYGNLNAYSSEAKQLLVPWRLRSAWRFATREYKAIDIDRLSLNFHLPTFFDHWVHVDSTDETKIAYFATPEHAAADRHTITTLGRYLTQFYSNAYNADTIRDIAAAFTSGTRRANYAIITDPTAIANAYMNGPSSCMSHNTRQYRTADVAHPTEVYGSANGASDLDLIVLKDQTGRITARSLIWQTQKIHGRLYGDTVALKDLLDELGYSHGSFEDARIAQISIENKTFVMPYIDRYNSQSYTDSNGAMYVQRRQNDTEYFYLYDSSHSDLPCAANTNGTLDVSTHVQCTVCGNYCAEEAAVQTEDTHQSLCNSCREDVCDVVDDRYQHLYYTQRPANTYYDPANNQYIRGNGITQLTDLYDEVFPGNGPFGTREQTSRLIIDGREHHVTSRDVVYLPERTLAGMTFQTTTTWIHKTNWAFVVLDGLRVNIARHHEDLELRPTSILEPV